MADNIVKIGMIQMKVLFSEPDKNIQRALELVKSAKANDRWVIVKALTTESDKLCYYLIDKSFNIKNLDWEIVNCDSIIQSHIISTFDSISFEKILKDKNIGLKFDK